jgi:hypothetical protein
VEVTNAAEFATREQRMRWLLDEIGAYLYTEDTCAECRSTLLETIRDAEERGPLNGYEERLTLERNERLVARFVERVEAMRAERNEREETRTGALR